LTIDTYTYNCTNTDTYTDIHHIIVVASVLTLTHMAKDCFEDVRQVVVIIVTLCVIVQTSMGNATINTITIFSVAAERPTATRIGIFKGEKRGDVNIIVVHCEQVARGTGASVTTLKARAMALMAIRPSSTALVPAPVPPALTSSPPRVAASQDESAATTPPAAWVPSATTSVSPEAPAQVA